MKMRLATATVCLATLLPLACRRDPTPPLKGASATAVEAAPVPPRELLAEGTLQRPSSVWRRLRDLGGGPIARLPVTYPLAVTTLVGASPLLAGLVEEASAVPLAVVDDAGAPTAVLAFRLRSGAEFLTALVNGADAHFRVEPSGNPTLTVLVPKDGSAAVPFGIAGNRLVVAGSRAALAVAGAYVARTQAEPKETSASLTVVAKKPALVGPLAEALDHGFRSALEGLTLADQANRAAHGRAPDFGDPRAVIGALSSLAGAATAVVASTSEIRLSAALEGPSPELTVDIVPDAQGAARDLVGELQVGDATLVGALPPSAELVLFFRRGGDRRASSIESGLSAVFGDRLTAADARTLARVTGDVDAALGPVAVVGALSVPEGPAAFLVAEGGDAERLAHVVKDVPELLRIGAIAGPLHAVLGNVRAVPSRRALPGVGSVPFVTLRRVVRTPGAPGAVEIAAASSGTRAAVVVGAERTPTHIVDLLGPRADPSLDPVIARALSRAGSRVALAALVRFHDPAGHAGWSVAALESDRSVARLEITASDVAAAAALHAATSP